MKYQDAIQRCREIGIKMQEHAETAERASRTYSATMELYNVAASAGDEKAMTQHRETLHTTVDTILDCGAMIAQLTRQQKEIANSVTDYPK